MGNTATLPDMRVGLEGVLRTANDKELRNAVEKIGFRKVTIREFDDNTKWTESFATGQPGYVNHQNIGSVLIHKARLSGPDPAFSRERWLVSKINAVETGGKPELFEIPNTIRLLNQDIQFMLPMKVIITKFIYDNRNSEKSIIHVKFNTNSNKKNYGSENSKSGGALTLEKFIEQVNSSNGEHDGWQLAWTAFKRDNTSIVLRYELDTIYSTKILGAGDRRDPYSKRGTFRVSTENNRILDRDQRLLNDGDKYGRVAPVASKIGASYLKSRAEITHEADEHYFGTTPSWWKKLCDLPQLKNQKLHSVTSISENSPYYRSLQLKKAEDFIGIGTRLNCMSTRDAAKHLLKG